MTMRRARGPDAEVPLAILSAGRLRIDPPQLCYTHTPDAWKRYRGLMDLSFSVPIHDASVALVRYDYASFACYNLPYVALHIENESADASSLFSAAGLGPSTCRVRRRTIALFRALRRAGARQSPPG